MSQLLLVNNLSAGVQGNLKTLVASREEVCLMQSNQLFVSIASVFFALAVAGFGLLLIWWLCRFLGVSVPHKLRKKLALENFLSCALAKIT
jgi:hypothetical protein